MCACPLRTDGLFRNKRAEQFQAPHGNFFSTRFMMLRCDAAHCAGRFGNAGDSDAHRCSARAPRPRTDWVRMRLPVRAGAHRTVV